MLEIIPAINAADWATVKKQIEWIAPYTEWVHLDAADGKFTKNITWHNAEDLGREGPKNIRFEAHLMLQDPERQLDPWIKAGVRRVILHWEALKPRGIFGGSARKKIEAVAKTLQENWVEFGIALLYRTNPQEIKPHLDLVDMVQVLAVEPGLAGQAAHSLEAFEAVRMIKQMANLAKPQLKIEIDGGINASNIKEFYLAGANVAAAASAIFGAQEPQRALESLKRALLG